MCEVPHPRARRAGAHLPRPSFITQFIPAAATPLPTTPRVPATPTAARSDCVEYVPRMELVTRWTPRHCAAAVGTAHESHSQSVSVPGPCFDEHAGGTLGRRGCERRAPVAHISERTFAYVQ